MFKEKGKRVDLYDPYLYVKFCIPIPVLYDLYVYISARHKKLRKHKIVSSLVKLE